MKTFQPSVISPVPHGPHAHGLLLSVPMVDWSAADRSKWKRPVSLVGGGWTRTSRGICRSNLSTSDQANYGPTSDFPLSEITIILAYAKNDSSLRWGTAFGTLGYMGSAEFLAKIPAANGIVYWDWSGGDEGDKRLSLYGLTFGDDVWAFTTGSRGMEIWQNGQKVAANSGNATRLAGPITFSLGGANFDCDLGDYSCVQVYDHQISPSLIEDLSYDPWLPNRMRRPSRVVAIPSMAGPAPGGVGLIGAGLCGHSPLID